jgi:hypothetical protein
MINFASSHLARTGTVALLALTASVAAGCSSDAAKSTATVAASPAGATIPSATTPVGTAPVGTNPVVTTAADSTPVAATDAVAPSGAVDPCKIVTTDDVAAAFGGTVAAGVINPDNEGCDYEITGQTNTGDSGILTQVSIEFGGDFSPYERTKVVFPDAVKIDGLGHDATYLEFGNQLHIDVGGQDVVISGLFPGDKAAVQAEVVAFGKVVLSKM